MKKNPQLLTKNSSYKKLSPDEFKKYGNNKQFPSDGYATSPKKPSNPPSNGGGGSAASIPLKEQVKPRKFTYYPPVEIKPKKYSKPIEEFPATRPQEVKLTSPRPKLEVKA